MFPTNLFGGSALFVLMLTSSLRSALLVALILALLAVWRRGSASIRYWIGGLALVGTLLIPVLALVGRMLGYRARYERYAGSPNPGRGSRKGA